MMQRLWAREHLLWPYHLRDRVQTPSPSEEASGSAHPHCYPKEVDFTSLQWWGGCWSGAKKYMQMHNKSSPDAGRHVWGVFSNKEYRNVAASLPGLTCSSFLKGRAEQYENPDQVKDSAILVPLYLMRHYFPLHMALHPWSMMAESGV